MSSRLFTVCALLLCLCIAAYGQDASTAETVKLLPKTVGDFRAQAARPLSDGKGDSSRKDAAVRGESEGVYVSSKGERLTVTFISTRSQAVAYAYLTRAAAEMRGENESGLAKLSGVGVAGVAVPGHAAFYKGPVFVSVKGKSNTGAGGEDGLIAFARAFAGALPEAENEIPVLVKHLPNWETAQDRAIYAVSQQGLEEAAGRQPIFDAINFNEGAEAVTATYDASRLVIVEYLTPQIAADTDARITARLGELRAGGQPLPSSYRRVGNYSVFVFNAPDATAAAQLTDKVKWEQSIQWLGENPLLLARAEKQHTREAVSLILGIAKTIGVFVMVCLGGGAVFGGLFFLRRRAQRLAAEGAYSDAGGMLRLNIDEVSAETDPARLLGSGEEKPLAQ